MRRVSGPSGPLRGSVPVPGDKSITHRGLLLAALAEGETRLQGVNPGRDCAALAGALRRLGAVVEREGGWPQQGTRNLRTAPGETPGYRVRGAAGRLHEPDRVLDLGNSGTALRLLAGAFAPSDAFAVLDGDRSVRRRPMGRITGPLRDMGARIDGPDGGERAPLAIRGGGLRGIRHRSPVASAQVKSCLLLAGLGAEGETWVEEPCPSRDHTERMLRHFGVSVEVSPDPVSGARRVGVRGGQPRAARDLRVPGDFSAAAFWIVAATVVPGSRITVSGVGLNPTRTGLVTVLARMGAAITVERQGDTGGEPIGDLEVHAAPLAGTVIEPDELPSLVDEIPIWAVAAALAAGESELRGAGELRRKESDRLRSIRRALTALGVPVSERPDGLVIQGLGGGPGRPPRLRGGRVQSQGDHRIAMAALVAGLAAEGPVEVTGCEMVDTSDPEFYPTLMTLVSAR